MTMTKLIAIALVATVLPACATFYYTPDSPSTQYDMRSNPFPVVQSTERGKSITVRQAPAQPTVRKATPKYQPAPVKRTSPTVRQVPDVMAPYIEPTVEPYVQPTDIAQPEATTAPAENDRSFFSRIFWNMLLIVGLAVGLTFAWRMKSVVSNWIQTKVLTSMIKKLST